MDQDEIKVMEVTISVISTIILMIAGIIGYSSNKHPIAGFFLGVGLVVLTIAVALTLFGIVYFVMRRIRMYLEKRNTRAK